MTREKENSPPTAASEVSQTNALKVLIADDIPTNRTLTARLLVRKGHHVMEVADGLQAYGAYQKEDFDVILMDIQMPVMDGLEATRRIRSWEKTSAKGQNPARKKRIPIIALTANDGDSARESYQKAGMDGVIPKPLDIKSVIAVIQKVIEEAESKT